MKYNGVFRIAYRTSKMIAGAGQLIEDGETVTGVRRLQPEHCLYMLTLGEGIGKYQWT